MILFGTANRQIATGKTREACANCQEPDSVNVFVMQRYAHIYHIPFIPDRKKTISQCTKCNYVLDKIYFPDSYKSDYESLDLNTKTPIWTYTGLCLLILLIIGVFISIKLDDTENAELVLSPQKGDIYEIKLSDEEYTLYKVDRVESNAVYVFENTYAVNQSGGVSDLLLKPFYTESVPIMKTDLKAMLEKGEIMDIERQ